MVGLSGRAQRPTLDEGARLAELLLDRHADELPTGLFAHNDLMALGALGVFKRHGLRCPRDISIVGYNNSPAIDQVDPPLTSVRYPGIEIGRAAGHRALEIIAGGEAATADLLLPSELIARGSTIRRRERRT